MAIAGEERVGGGSAQDVIEWANTAANPLGTPEKASKRYVPRLLPKPEAIVEERKEQSTAWETESWQRKW